MTFLPVLAAQKMRKSFFPTPSEAAENETDSLIRIETFGFCPKIKALRSTDDCWEVLDSSVPQSCEVYESHHPKTVATNGEFS